VSAGPLSSTSFRWLLAGRTSTVLGNAMAPVALAFAVLDLTGSASDLGLVVACRSVANVVVLLFGGVLADRLPRGLLLAGASAAAALTQGVVAALVITGTASIPVLALLSVVNGALAAISFPAAAALVPSTVASAQLRSANALLRLSLNGGAIVSVSVGSLLIAALGPGIGLAIDAGSFALAALLFAVLDARLRSAPALTFAGQVEEGAAPSSVLQDLREGWREFRSRTWVWVVVAQFAVVNAAFVGAVSILGPLVADDSFGRGSWGLILAGETVGLAAGSLLALKWRPRRALGIGVALTAVCALPVAGLALTPNVLLLLVMFGLGGLALEQVSVAWNQSLQHHVPADRLARVYSYDAAGSFVAIPVGEIAVGPLAAAFGSPTVLLGCAAVIVAACAAAASVRSIWAVRAPGASGRRPVPVSAAVPHSEPTAR
jgi:MFS family permease